MSRHYPLVIVFLRSKYRHEFTSLARPTRLPLGFLDFGSTDGSVIAASVWGF